LENIASSMHDQPSRKTPITLFQQSIWKGLGVVAASVTLVAIMMIPVLVHRATAIPWGDLGFNTQERYKFVEITDVDPGSPAARAGLKPGDRIDVTATPLRYRNDIFTGMTDMPGDVSELRVTRAGRSFVAHLVSGADPANTHAEGVWVSLSRLRVPLMVGTGLTLILLRPSWMTFGFFVFCLSRLGWFGVELYLGGLSAIVFRGLVSALDVLGAIGFLVFALRFPRDNPTGWKHGVDAATPYLCGLAILPLIGTISARVFGAALAPIDPTIEIVSYGLFAVAAAAIIDTFVRSSGEDRQRLRWVIAGCILGVSTGPLIAALGYINAGLDSQEWGIWVIRIFLPLLLPLAIAYGVLWHRVIDLRFVLTRSLTYGVLAGGFVLLLLLADWLGVRFLSGTRNQTLVLVAVAIALGFALRPLLVRVQRFIDHILFRAQFNARERLVANAEAIRNARSGDELESILTSGVMSALDLTSAAVFLPAGDGGFIRGVSSGWPSSSDWHIVRDGPAVKSLDVNSATRLDSRSALPGFVAPPGALAPILALPVKTNGKLHACFVYGPHINGADFNPEEIAELRWLATEAAMTWHSISLREAHPTEIAGLHQKFA
jgi:hypothetical protein